MKIGDLVRPMRHDIKKNVPIVERDWFGVIIDFTGDYYGPGNPHIEPPECPVVYWNPKFQAEIEDPKQIEVIV